MTGIRIVAPFRPLPLESGVHRYLAAFDWIAAVRMLVQSATIACRCPVHVITDVDTDLPVPTLRYITTHRRLMLWVLEACVKYLESADFDRDTVMLDCDQLIYHDLVSGFTPDADLTVLIRPRSKHMDGDRSQPFLNGVQFWSHAAKPRLVAFYRAALARAEAMPDNQIVWGADTDAVRELLEPLSVGLHDRSGLHVRMIDSDAVLVSFSRALDKQIAKGAFRPPDQPVLDFRGRRKQAMQRAYQATFGVLA